MQIVRNQSLNRFILAIIFLLLLYAFYEQSFVKNDFPKQVAEARTAYSRGNLWWLLVVALLMPLNWALEAVKWNVLLARYKWDDFTESCKAILAGVTTSFVTPGRSGQFAGRILFLEDDDKVKGIHLSFISGLAQTLVTVLAALFAIYYLGYGVISLRLLLVLTFVSFLLYFGIRTLYTLLRKWNLLVAHHWTLTPKEIPSFEVLFSVLVLSALRYLVYLVQHLLVFWFFSVPIASLSLLASSAEYLFLQSISPVIPFADMGVRGNLALFIFEQLNVNAVVVVTTVLLVWFINLAIPAFVGYLFILLKNKNDRSER